MKNRHIRAFVSSSLSIIPMIAIIFVLHFSKLASITTASSNANVFLLLIGMVVLISGLALFQIGASSSLTKVGEYMGASLSKQKKVFIVVIFTFALGLLITCAEPSILIVSKQITVFENPTFNMLILVGGIALGVGVFVVIGVLRIIYHKPLKLWYVFFYCLTFMLICLIAMDPQKRILLPFIFDAGGVTTGSATVPFILAMGAGVAAVRGGKNATNDSFGLVGVASVGPIISTALVLLIKANVPPYVVPTTENINLFMRFVYALIPTSNGLGSLIEVIIALAPILIIFAIYNFLYLRMPKRKILKLLIGFIFTYFGLVLFLSAASAAMTPVGRVVGYELAKQNDIIIILICFAIGLVTILCEPAVHVLTKQMETISDGRITKKTVLIALSLGVGLAIALAALRALLDFSILYIVVPGYALSLFLSFLCPDIYTAMAFDSGGTASGPMAASFVLPMILGIVNSRYDGNSDKLYELGFGVVALIAMTPIIAIQILGVVESVKSKQTYAFMRKHVYSADDAQIINF